MAYVKVKYHPAASQLIKYVFSEKKPDDPAHGENCPAEEEGAKGVFQAIREHFNAKDGIQAIHVIQSWGPDESKKLTAEHINKMGQDLASRYFEGHQYLVVTHTHAEHRHNHIIVNSVHMDTGKRITKSTNTTISCATLAIRFAAKMVSPLLTATLMSGVSVCPNGFKRSTATAALICTR